MISRDLAAKIRFEVLIKNRSPGSVARANSLSLSQIERIVDGILVPCPEERLVVQPPYTMRNRKLTTAQRMEVAHLICFGATLRKLSENYGVQIRAIQHIKENLTILADANARPRKPAAGKLCVNTVAEARYRYYQSGESVGLIAASLFTKYKTLYGALSFRSYRPQHGLMPKEKVTLEDPDDKMAFWLYIYGADKAFVKEATGIEPDKLQELVRLNSEVAS